MAEAEDVDTVDLVEAESLAVAAPGEGEKDPDPIEPVAVDGPAASARGELGAEGVEPVAGESATASEQDTAAEVIDPIETEDPAASARGELAVEGLEPVAGESPAVGPPGELEAKGPDPIDSVEAADASARGEMEAVIEAVLFVASEPVSRTRLLDLFAEEEWETAAQALEAVLARYGGGEGRGVMAEEVAGGVRLVTRPELVGWLRRFFEVSGGSKLSMAALETLAIVAYRQPITAPEIQELRSVNPSGVLSTLLQRRLVRIAGRKEVVGKPFLYATTREFLVHFGLKSLKDLPPLEEFEETFGEGGGELAGGVLSAEMGEPHGSGEDREERFLQEAAALEESAAGAPAPGEGEPGPGSASPGRGTSPGEFTGDESGDGASAEETSTRKPRGSREPRESRAAVLEELEELDELNEVDEVEAEVP